LKHGLENRDKAGFATGVFDRPEPLQTSAGFESHYFRIVGWFQDVKDFDDSKRRF